MSMGDKILGQQRERRLIREYIAEFYPKVRVIFGCPLGPVPESSIATYGFRQALRVARGIRPEVDALAIYDGQLVLIEAKIIKWMDGLSKLPVYASLVPSTYELQEYKDYRVAMRLCTPWTNETIDQAAEKLGVKVSIFSPPWIAEYMETVHHYYTSDYRKARDEKLRLRKLFGLE